MLRFFCVQYVLVLALLQATAQRIEILTMEREGTAGVYLSEKDKIACIIDGGRKGGLSKPRLDGKPVLAALLSQGYEELVLSCSHPHEDHAAGLRELVLSDPEIVKFRRITFVDSGYPGAESLFQLFREAHPSYPAEQVRYSSAKERNAFAGIWSEKSGLKIENFEYTPTKGATTHGHATIHHVIIEKEGQRKFLVDFDDADDALVKQWAEWAKERPSVRRPDVIIAPHHNADTVNISPLLDPQIRPKACIVTANPGNKFLHPGPHNTVKWVESLGIDNVFVTGAHNNIHVSEKGVTTVNNRPAREAMVDSVLLPMRATLDRQIAEIEERALERKLDRNEITRYEQLKNKTTAVEKLTGWFNGGGGNDGYNFGSLPVSRPPGPSGPVPSANGVGDFTKLRDAFENALTKPTAVQTPFLPLHISASSGAAARAAKFSAGIRMIPIRGGIILGNSISPSSGRVKKASITLTDGEPNIAITAEQDNETKDCNFDEMTASELWAAYNFVNPNAELRSSFKIDETENGLVGKSGDLSGNAGWRFGIHPAIAGTLVAHDAMRLDMAVAKAKLQLSDLNIPDFETYQWYDSVPILRIEDGRVRIWAASEPPNTLLRIRFWTNALPNWVRSRSSLSNDLRAELVRRAVKEAGGEESLLLLPASAQKTLGDKVAGQITAELEARGGGNVPYDERRLIERMSANFDAFRRIERFARTVSVLHWIADTNPSGLPPLPKHLHLRRFEVPAQLTTDQVGFISPAKELVLIKTTEGDMTFELWPDVAPKTVEHFKKLVRNEFYNGTAFHRVIKGFMIQGGDPLTKDLNVGLWGTGGPGYTIQAEFNDRSHERGVISMARSAKPDSAGSQFFICHGDASFLDHKYTAFGKLISGDDVLDTIANVRVISNGTEVSRPAQRVGVTAIEIKSRASL